ncbi:unnamed protein product, partial [Medioppia subpectinata]
MFVANVFLTLMLTIAGINAAPKVTIDVNFEYFCIDCKVFIGDQLYPTYKTLGDIFEYKLNTFSYGRFNKTTKPDGTFDLEFKNATQVAGTLIQSCAMEIMPQDQSLALLACMFKSAQYDNADVAGKQCANELNLKWEAIEECAKGPLGRGLYLRGLEHMEAVKPKITWFPWIIVNG